MKSKSALSSEREHQRKVIKHLRANYDVLFSATVGGMDMRPLERIKMVNDGYVKGIPDLLIFEPRGQYHGLMIEMKKPGGKPTPEQLEWQTGLNKKGYKSCICYGVEEGIQCIDEYMKWQEQNIPAEQDKN